MYRKRKGNVYASEIAEYLNAELVGQDFTVDSPSTAGWPAPNTMLYLDRVEDYAALSGNETADILILTPAALPESDRHACIVCPNPRLAFVQTLYEFFVSPELSAIHPSAVIAAGAQLGRNISVGPFARIGPDVRIGHNVRILAGAALSGRVDVGDWAVIKDNAVIGSEGYDFVLDDAGKPLPIPHLGIIFIGSGTWIGANATVERAEIRDTIIAEDVKVDDLVHIGGGCRIGARSMITAGSVLGRDVTIGADCYLAPNVSVREKVAFGDRVMVGIGSTVLDNLAGGGVFAGSPAKFLKSYK